MDTTLQLEFIHNKAREEDTSAMLQTPRKLIYFVHFDYYQIRLSSIYIDSIMVKSNYIKNIKYKIQK